MRQIILTVVVLIVSMPSTIAAQGVPQLDARVEALEQQMATLVSRFIALRQRVIVLENAHQHKTFTVDCTAGETVSAALAQTAGRSNPVTIRITGRCVESVSVNRDDVTLEGAGAGAGIQGATLDVTPLIVRAQRVSIRQLALQGGLGLVVRDGGSAGATNVMVTGSQTGLNVTFNSLLIISDSTIENNGSGALVGRDSFLSARNTTFRNNSSGIGLPLGRAQFINSVIEGSGSGFGLSVGAGSFVSMSATAIRTFATGMWLQGGFAGLGDGTIVENNGEGVRAEGGALIALGAATIQNNQGNGIQLGDVTVLSSSIFPSTATITNNGGWGIFCAGPPALPQVPTSIPTAGNTAGQINCPGYTP